MPFEHTLPADAIHTADSPIFSETSAPEAILVHHETARGHWVVLSIHSGELVFVDLAHDARVTLVEDQEWVIAPESPHRVEIVAPVSFQFAFYQDQEASQRAR